VAHTEFTRFTPDTTRKKELQALLRQIRQTAIAFDRNGKVEGASAIASPIFDGEGKVFASVSAAGPTERMEMQREQIEPLVRKAGERISRILGYSRDYPPQVGR
jgi:DNA-binding IclR family transcriptional regulator